LQAGPLTGAFASSAKPSTLSTEAQALVLAALSNTAVKAGIVLFAESPGLRRALLPGMLLMLGTGIAAAFLL
jgi:uncharacterized membrane protein (DUF4010 family)